MKLFAVCGEIDALAGRTDFNIPVACNVLLLGIFGAALKKLMLAETQHWCRFKHCVSYGKFIRNRDNAYSLSAWTGDVCVSHTVPIDWLARIESLPGRKFNS